MRNTFTDLLVIACCAFFCRPCFAAVASTAQNQTELPKVTKFGDITLFQHVPDRFNADNSVVEAFLSRDGSILAFRYAHVGYVYDLKSAKLLQQVGSAQSPAGSVMLSPDGRWIAWITDRRDPEAIRELKVFELPQCRQVFHTQVGNWMLLAPIGFSADGNALLYHDDGRREYVKVQLSDSKELAHWSARDDWPREPYIRDGFRDRVFFSPDQKWALRYSRVYDVNIGKMLPNVKPPEYFSDAEFLPDAKLRIIEGTGTVETWDLQSQSRLSRIEPQQLIDNAAKGFIKGTRYALLAAPSGLGKLDCTTGKMVGWTSRYSINLENAGVKTELPLAGILAFSADGRWIALRTGDEFRSDVLIVPMPSDSDFRPAAASSPALSTPRAIPLAATRPAATAPTHTEADLKSPEWWINLARIETQYSPDQMFYVEITTAIILAQKDDAAGANAAVARAEAILKQRPALALQAGNLVYARARIQQGSNWKNPDGDFKTKLAEMRANPTESVANFKDYGEAAKLRYSGKIAEYNALRQPLVDALKNAPGAPSRQKSTGDILMFDLATGNLTEAETGFAASGLEEKGIIFAFLFATEIPTALGDLQTLQGMGTLAAKLAPHDAPNVFNYIVRVHVADNQLEPLLKWIQTFPSPDSRCQLYLVASSTLAPPN